MNNGFEDSIKQIAKGGGIIFLGIFISKFFSYLFRLITARIGSGDYGILMLAISITVLISILATLGLDHGVYRFVASFLEEKQYGKVKGVIYTSLVLPFIISLLITFILFFYADWIASTLFPNIDSYKLTTMIKILSFSIPFISISRMLNSSFRSFKMPQYEVYTKNIIDPLTKFLLGLVIVLAGFGVITVSYSYLFGIILSVLVGLFLLRKLLKKFIGNVKAFFVNKELLYYSFPLISFGLFLTFTTSIDTFMLGHFTNEKFVGIYNAAMPSAQLLYIFPYAILSLFLPVLVSLYVQNKKQDWSEIYKTVTKWIFLVNLTIMGFLVILSKEFLQIFFGTEYGEGWLILIILLLGFFIHFLFYTSENLLLILKKSKLIFWNSLICAFLNLVLNFALIPTYGMIGAAISTSISFILWGLLHLVQSYYFCRVIPFKFSYLKILLSVIFCCFIFYFFKSYLLIFNLFGFVSLFVGFMFVLLLLLFLTRTFESDDKFIFETIKKKLFESFRHSKH